MRDYSKFFTPQKIARRLIEFADVYPFMKVLEPHAGNGAIVNELRERFGGNLDIQAIEINTAHWSDLRGANKIALCNFLDWPAQGQYDRVIANPPFGNDADLHNHFCKMIAQLKPNGILSTILPMDFSVPQCAHILYSSRIENWSKNSDGTMTAIKHVKCMPMPHYEKIFTVRNMLEMIRDQCVCGCQRDQAEDFAGKSLNVLESLT